MDSALHTIHERTSANNYDVGHSISDADIAELVSDAAQAPSAFNIQHWRFIAVTEPERKAALMGAAYGQQKVGDAAVTFIVIGDLQGHRELPGILADSVSAGILPSETAEGWVRAANNMYSSEAFARDEAIRSASFAAMTLMLAAKARGMVSGPMIGFDPAKVAELFDISDRYVPVLLLSVGRGTTGNWPRKPRLGTDRVLAFNRSTFG